MRCRQPVRRCATRRRPCHEPSWGRSLVVTVYVLVAIAGVGAQPAAKFEAPERQSAGLSVILENVTGSIRPGTISRPAR